MGVTPLPIPSGKRGLTASAGAAAFLPLSLDSVVLVAMFVVILAAFLTYLIYRGSADEAQDESSNLATPEGDSSMEKQPSKEPTSAPKRVSGVANRSNHVVLGVAIVALLLGAAALGFVALNSGPKAPSYTPTTVSVQIAVVPDLQGSGWDAWSPNLIVVHEGDTVNLTVLNADTMPHGFDLPAFNVNKPIPAATQNTTTGDITPSVTTITFVANQVGTFEFSCNVYCGPGHDDMVGNAVVLPD